jgi:arylsulfatase
LSRALFRLSCVALAALSLSALPLRAAPPRPNIVVILADDLGYSDLGCYGGEIATPNLDRLAAGGLRFTQFYNAARCCPSRAALMTGLYPHQAGVGAMTFDTGQPGYRGFLTENTATIAEVLSAAGYRTLMAGKWHLSVTKDSPRNALWVSHRLDLGPFSDPATYPAGRGFDEHYGTIWGVVDYFDPFSLVHNTQPIESVPDGYYYTDALTEEGVRMIRSSAKNANSGEQPFFLYLAYTAPHWPLQAPAEDIAKYVERYKDGWRPTRQKRFERAVEQGIFSKETAKLSDPIEGPPWEQEAHREWEARAMAVHAAMVSRMDTGIGRVIDELRSQGLDENTLVFFLSDNGASPERVTRPGFDRPSHLRNGRGISYWSPKEPGPLPGPEDTYAGIGRRWANVVNAPFRFWKATTYEGGICAPMIAYWPGTIQAGLTDDVGHVIDLSATCYDLAGAAYPSTRNGNAVTPLEGQSLRPVLEGGHRSGHDSLFWEHENNRAVRNGNWKLVGPKNRDWELYNLAVDRTETENVADRNSEIVSRLAKSYEEWALRANVVPTAAPSK